ncbi:oligopeptide/dipeptide ABC transporter ATP-binding protein, partial [Streptomyces sp. 8L]|uniref:oligopeptide/dipeptide ABC transporter ATP-binding protein n=1 Tax=Streptomyces sp. 8L TaxID=2877242 RepID=UPI0035A946AC|nr:hypothetical protein [Streptomyces sp. 8L]
LPPAWGVGAVRGAGGGVCPGGGGGGGGRGGGGPPPPHHPYTGALLASVPDPDTPHTGELPTIPGRVPPLGERSGGCAFRDRCPKAEDRCAERPPLAEVTPGGSAAACWFPDHTDAVRPGGPAVEDPAGPDEESTS